MGRNNTDFYATIFSLGTDVDLKDTSRYAVYATQGGLGLPDRDYYLKPSFASQKAAYQTYVAKLLALVGWPEPETNAAAVVAFETRVADASWTELSNATSRALTIRKRRASLRLCPPASPGNDSC
jgi:putative endopeptidase